MPSITSSPTPPPPTGSGIQTLPTGDRHIPASTRADGSLRKEIKIRPGYRPPEDVEVYKNRTAEAWKSKGTGGVPGAATLKESGAEEEKSGAAGKNAKRREARKRAKAAEGGDKQGSDAEEANEDNVAIPIPNATPKSAGDKATNGLSALTLTADVKQEEEGLEVEKEKQARALKKKLRQARELKEKKDSGEGLLPEQFAKVIKIQELIRQLDALGFDSDGARKAKDIR